MLVKRFCKRSSLVLLSLCALSTILLSPAFAQSRGYHDSHIGSWLTGACGMGWFGMIMMMLFWVLVISAIIFLIQRLVRSSGDKTSRSNKGADSNAIDILKERYARGEITRDEFEAMKKEILR